MSFDKSLSNTLKLFRSSEYKFREITTDDGINISLEKINRKEYLIKKVCKELEYQLKEELQDRDKIYNLGISSVTLLISETKESEELDYVIHNYDILETINEKEFEKLENDF